MFSNIQKIKEWYENTYKELGYSWGVPDIAYKDFIKYCGVDTKKLHLPLDKKFLDIACGSGQLLKIAEKSFLQPYGTEISTEAIKLAEKKVPNAYIMELQTENLHLIDDDFFDYITCIGSLEHFLDIDKSLQEMCRVGNKDATYCILVPNSDSWFRNKTDQEEINEQMFSLKEWGTKFKNNGFIIDKIHRDRWHIIKPQSFLMKILNALTPKTYFNSLVFVLRKDIYERPYPVEPSVCGTYGRKFRKLQ